MGRRPSGAPAPSTTPVTSASRWTRPST